MCVLAFDIGGANLKAADGCGWAKCVPIALSADAAQLALTITEMIDLAPPSMELAITMTGELCDVFRTKAAGVRQILGAVVAAAAGRRVGVYLIDGRLVSVAEALERPRLAAASNWHALARFACRFIGRHVGLLVDVGSTTTDIVPLADGQVAARGATDVQRLIAGELVYTGVGRTPICAVASSLPYRGESCPLAAEWFATTVDAYVVVGDVPEQPGSTATADGRSLTKLDARERLARMFCADGETFDDRDARSAAEAIRAAQVNRLTAAIAQAIAGLRTSVECVVISGAGEFLARRVAAAALPQSRVVSLAVQLGADASVCAPAHALAVLTREARAR